MNILKNVLKNLLKIFIMFFIFSFILSIIYYIGLINTELLNYIRLIGFVLIIYFNGNNESKRLNKNNLIHGLLTGIGIIIIFFLIVLITKYKIDFKLIIYYFLILAISVLSSFRKKKLVK